MSPEITHRQLEIIDSAGRILTVAGVGGLTIKNLAKEMRFSESAIYRHFTSKEEIIVAMLNYLAESMEVRLARAIQAHLSPSEKFKALFNSQMEFFNTNPHFVVAVFSDGLMEGSKTINDAIFKIMQVKMKYLQPVIAEGVKQAEFTDSVTPEQLIHIVMGAFRLQMFKWRVAEFKFDLTKSGENLIQALLTLIYAK